MDMKLASLWHLYRSSKPRESAISIPDYTIAAAHAAVLSCKLKQRYTNVRLAQVSLHNGTLSTFEEAYTEVQLEAFKTPVNLESMFVENSVKRILIEGQPGCGKSTFAFKLAYDWAQREEYVKRFKLVFVVLFRTLRRKSIEEVISESTGIGSPKTIENLLAENEENILLILDGFDELSLNRRASILPILRRKKYERMTVLVTFRTRTGEFCLLNEVFFDVCVQITGVKNRKQFLDRALNGNPDAKRILTALDKNFEDITSSPLLLISLACLMSRRGNRTVPQTVMYKSLVNFLIGRNLRKHGENKMPNLFDYGEPVSKFHVTFRDFGELAFSKVWEENPEFECNDLTTAVYSLGFLNKREKVDTFYAFNRAMMEFCAAYYICHQFKVVKPIAELHINELLLKLKESNLFFPFVVGLLEEKAIELFLQMKMNAFWFLANENYLWNMLAQVFPDEETMPQLYSAIEPLIPSWIQLESEKLENFNSSILIQKIIQLAIKKRTISRITVTNSMDLNISLDVVLQELVIYIMPNQPSQVMSFEQIQCKQLHFIFDDQFLHLDQSEESVYKYFDLLTSIEAIESNLTLCGAHVFEAVKRYFNQESLANKKIRHINAKVTDQNEITIIEQLIEKNKVSSLRIGFQTTDLVVKHFFDCVAKAASLESLDVISLEMNITVDLFELTQSGTKDYDFLQFQNCKVCWSGPIDTFTGIRSLNLLNCSLLNSIPIQSKSLTCKASQLTIEPKNEFLQELSLQMDDVYGSLDFAGCDFWSLNSLYIYFEESFMEIEASRLANWILQLGIKRLILENHVEKYDPRKNVISYLLGYWLDKQENVNLQLLETVDYHFNFGADDKVQVMNLSSALTYLLILMRHNKINIINVICSINVWKLIMQAELIDESLFALSHYYYGSKNDDPEYYKYMYNSVNSKLNSFTIKKISFSNDFNVKSHRI